MFGPIPNDSVEAEDTSPSCSSSSDDNEIEGGAGEVATTVFCGGGGGSVFGGIDSLLLRLLELSEFGPLI